MRRMMCVLMITGLSSPVIAQMAPEPFLLLEVSRDCATPEEDDLLVDAIELRMPNAFIIRGAVESVTPDWRVSWQTRGDADCELTFASKDNSSTMALGPHPGVDEIELAEERIRVVRATSRSEETADPPGRVCIRDEELRIATTCGSLVPLVLQKPGGRPTPVDAFRRGRPIPDGTQLEGPQ